MGKKYILSKRKASTASDTAGSNRERKAEVVGNVSKRKKNKESVSVFDLELKEIRDYVDFSEDVAKHSASGDSEESEDGGRRITDDNGDLGGNSVEVHIGDDDIPSTSKDTAGALFPGDLHKHVAALEEAVLDIVAYIREKRLKKKEQDERQHEQEEEGEEAPIEESPKEAASEAEEELEKETAADVEIKGEEGEEAPAEEVLVAADAKITGEEAILKKQPKLLRKKELKLTKMIWSWIS
ncbi:bone sialoprotein 2-like [Capsicum annuum]|uniref:bone sialoprotein 2-like n=1 Tax=Capsicum annuum TaxID=4072 RepID=UPI001FB17D6D|nr:bone sialoprotein 2-like [Capsicum annuum]